MTPLLAALLLLSPPSLAGGGRKERSDAPRGRQLAGGEGYNRDVRPILAENCFVCHGPDSGSRQANLRLDRPGWDGKKFLGRVLSGEMPPKSSHKTLTPAQKTTLRRWIDSGARYEKHWSFTSPSKRPAAFRPSPASEEGSFSSDTIDALVRTRLQKEGLNFSPEADRETWLRRVSLDLTGLPPTLSELDGFLADGASGAHERVVDRLLRSPHYGERMATPWLDIARYGDSYGYQSDQLETVWPWRDWVVKAFNENKPYDRFVTEQIAGDLLEGATKDTRLATAFNRLHRMTNEGGSVAEEWRLEAVADRVKTFGTAFLGLTLECARCHDHKFDPVTQKDFYRLSAFFSSIDEHGLYDYAHITPTPSVLLPTREQARILGETKEAVLQAQSALQSTQKASRASAASSPGNDRVGYYGFETLDGVEHTDAVPLVAGKVGKAARFDGENNVHFGDRVRFARHTPFTIAFWLKTPLPDKEPVVVFAATSGTDTGPFGYDLMLDKSGALTARLVRHWPGNAIAVRTEGIVPANIWTRIALTYDGSSRAAGLKLYIDGKPAPAKTLKDRLWKGIGSAKLTFGQRFRDRGLSGGLLDEIEVFNRALTPAELQGEPDALPPEIRAAQARLDAAREKLWRAEDPILEVMCLEELPAPRPTYVLARGAYDAPKTARVAPGTPAFLPLRLPEGDGSEPASAPRGRLDLARWLVDGKNPLTARVFVNRLWQQFFGRGLVETSDDFGVQGKLPSHPELLDALALDFQRDWDIKRLVKTIVLSKTYGQDSTASEALQARDPGNVLLARGPSGRLPAEVIRDGALAASGLLERRLSGPPVSPYQPGDLWREANSMSPAYAQSHGPDLYRRSLYSVVKRTAPLPNMTVFDAPGREVCTARRSATSTPLQALVLLNDTQFVEAARVLGERMLKEGGPTDAERLTLAFRLLTARRPMAEEARLLGRLYETQRQLFRTAPESAKKLLAVGEKPVDGRLDPVEVAAATAVAQAILNLDATVWKR